MTKRKIVMFVGRRVQDVSSVKALDGGSAGGGLGVYTVPRESDQRLP